MARIYRLSDRIKVKIDDITVTVSPLSNHQKAEIQTHLLGLHRGDIHAATKGMLLSMKYAVKDIKGLEDSDGEYKCQFDNDGNLSDETLEDLYNLENSVKLLQVCQELVSGVPKSFKDKDGNPIDGVEVISEESQPKKK